MPSPKTASKSGPHHARSLRSHKALRIVGMVATGSLVFAGTAAAAMYVDFQNAVDVSDVSDLVEGASPEPPRDPDDPFAGKALNILVMGTDYRDAENAAIAGEEEGMRSDTTFVVHVSGDRTRMEVVSIPRDSLVDIPSCNLSDGSTSKPRKDTMFNEAFQIGAGQDDDMVGAAACTITTVQSLTGLTITDHVVLKMNGVVGVVNAIGGVTMCFPEPMKENPRYGTLDLPAGQTTLNGDQAISYLRARHGTGMGLEMGSDLSRIPRQQAFIDSMLREVLSKNLITNAPELYGMIKAVLSSVSASPSLAGLDSLAGLAFSLKDIDTNEIVFSELPVIDAPTDKNRVVWTKDAQAIWDRMAADEPPPGHETPAPTDVAPDTGAVQGTDPAAGTDPEAGTDPGTDPGAGAGEVAPPVAPPVVEERLPGVC
ncbi:transcriptional regulator [Oerskovia sp. Root918]|uniref:LCP family protein n=1 Tax=unclassified Oerskovia TaxID=2619021 RepID=UPI0006FE23F5|nr:MULTISPECIES: LCP family protein [unclassified Oerskovia]KRC35399.1 transcriptional regulator [Oerskovia sp. Root22]KRD36650.1 transcriptional regulator [Oerskovia sp. Root918]